MSIWVRSQDKGYLVKNPIIDIDIKKNEVYILDRTYAKEPFIGRILGVYKSKERAIEVLDEIQYKIQGLNDDFYFKVSKETELKKYEGYQKQHKDIVYQMPEE